MKENKLVPYVESAAVTPMQRAMNRMERWTQYWPLTISSTIVYNMSNNVEALTKVLQLYFFNFHNFFDIYFFIKKLFFFLVDCQRRINR